MIAADGPAPRGGPFAATRLGYEAGGASAAIWSFFTVLHCLAEAQGFSAWRAFGNTLLAGAVILLPLLLLIAVAVLIPMLVGRPS
jgi:hypothetical protein